MAEFSKQWCDLYDPEMPHDFDIEVISQKLKPDYYQSFICEGFGFSAIGKDSEGNTILFFRDFEDGRTYNGWIDYAEFINEQKNKRL